MVASLKEIFGVGGDMMFYIRIMTKQKQKKEEFTVTWHDLLISPEESRRRLNNFFDMIFAEVVKARESSVETKE